MFNEKQDNEQIDYIVLNNILQYYSVNKLKDLSSHIKNSTLKELLKLT